MEKVYSKEDLIYSMLLNIKDGMEEAITYIDENKNNIDWNIIMENLNEKEVELVYILENIKDKAKKE